MDVARISGHPLFHRLASERRCLGFVLATAMAVTYFAYILTIAFRPTLLGTLIFEGSVITWGVVIGAGLLSFGFILTAVYVLVANTRLDALSQRLQEDLK
jgi:uncharacterized membrane protein (DUF485 family)